jgi:hypothetical protein
MPGLRSVPSEALIPDREAGTHWKDVCRASQFEPSHSRTGGLLRPLPSLTGKWPGVSGGPRCPEAILQL